MQSVFLTDNSMCHGFNKKRTETAILSTLLLLAEQQKHVAPNVSTFLNQQKQKTLREKLPDDNKNVYIYIYITHLQPSPPTLPPTSAIFSSNFLKSQFSLKSDHQVPLQVSCFISFSFPLNFSVFITSLSLVLFVSLICYFFLIIFFFFHLKMQSSSFLESLFSCITVNLCGLIALYI